MKNYDEPIFPPVPVEEYSGLVGEAVTIRRWYNRSTKDWVVQLLDKDEYQLGSAIYLYEKKDAFNVKPTDFAGT